MVSVRLSVSKVFRPEREKSDHEIHDTTRESGSKWTWFGNPTHKGDTLSTYRYSVRACSH